MLNAGIVHQNIAGPDPLDQGAAVLRLGHIGGDIACLHPMSPPKVGGKIMILGPVSEAVQDYIRPGAGQFFGNAQTDAGI